MSRQVLFNGAVLIRPGAATKIDASKFENVALTGLGICGLIGTADGGAPRTLQSFQSAKGVKDFYRSGDLVEAAQMVAQPSADTRIPQGASQIVCYKINNSVQASLVHDTVLTLTAKDYGLHTNNIRAAISSSGGNLRVFTASSINEFGLVVSEVSPEFGGTDYAKMLIQYVGADPGAVTMTINVTGLTTTTSATPAEDLVLTWANYPDLESLVRYIDGLAAYTCSVLITNGPNFAPSQLDGLAAVDIKTVALNVYGHNYDLITWINTNSSLMTAVVAPLASTGPRAVLAEVALAGGTVGTSANADWTTAFTAMGTLRVNQLIPLIHQDGSVTGDGTYTFVSVAAGLAAHAKLLSSTVGRSERQAWLGMVATRTAFIAQAVLMNTEHVCLSAQKASRLSAVSGNVTVFAEWAHACITAGMRAGAPLGEPITWKYIDVIALTQDASWDNNDPDDIELLLLNGCMSSALIAGKGFRIEKGITTYTRSDNDAFTEESVVQGWKHIAFVWRSALEDRYTGRPGSIQMVETVKPFSVVILRKLRDEGAITDSYVNGQVTPGYRNISVELEGAVLSVGGTVSPTPGINFILNTLVVVPPQISL